MGSYDDDEVLPPPPRGGRWVAPPRALPYPDDDAPLPPPAFFRPPDRPAAAYPAERPGYGHQFEGQQPPPAAGAPSRASNDPEVMRPPGSIGPGPAPRAPAAAAPAATGTVPATTASLPPEDQPETGQPKELPENLRRQLVDFQTKEPAGTIVVDTPHTYLYYVLGNGRAMRYGVRVGREGFTWKGVQKITKKTEWPDWFPPTEMIERQPYLPRFMAGGPGNPLGARAMYLGNTVYRIHGTNQPSTIGKFVSSGCIGMLNEDVSDLFDRAKVGTRVVVWPGGPPPGMATASAQPAPVAGPPAPQAQTYIGPPPVPPTAVPPLPPPVTVR